MNALTHSLKIPPSTPDASIRNGDTASHPPGTLPPPQDLGNAALYGYAPAPGTTRYDGWTPDKQRIFLEALSEGSSVTHACRIVGLTKQSAYAFRGRAAGAAFAIGWQAAMLLGRQILADDLMDRALNGITDTFTYRNGETAERHRHDNRLAMAMLTRLDRLADSAHAEATHAAARLVAGDFDQFLSLIGRDAGPARAGLFLNARVSEASPDDLAPIRALARADRWLRTHADEVDTADLDPAARAGWSAEQWARAEAAGLLVLAPAPPPQPDSRDGNGQLGQLDGEEDAAERGPVWWCDWRGEWRTSFPPPPDFLGEEDGDYGEPPYSRTLTEEEEAVADAPWRAEIEAREAAETLERDAWFGFTPAPSARLPIPEDEDEEDWDDEDWDDDDDEEDEEDEEDEDDDAGEDEDEPNDPGNAS